MPFEPRVAACAARPWGHRGPDALLARWPWEKPAPSHNRVSALQQDVVEISPPECRGEARWGRRPCRQSPGVGRFPIRIGSSMCAGYLPAGACSLLRTCLCLQSDQSRGFRACHTSRTSRCTRQSAGRFCLARPAYFTAASQAVLRPSSGHPHIGSVRQPEVSETGQPSSPCFKFALATPSIPGYLSSCAHCRDRKSGRRGKLGPGSMRNITSSVQ